MPETVTRDLKVDDGSGKVTIRLNGHLGNIVVGGNGQDGNLLVFPEVDGGGQPITDTTQSSNAAFHLDAKEGHARIGGAGKFGSLVIHDGGGHEAIKLDSFGQVTMGSGVSKGVLVLKNSSGVETIRADGGKGDIFLANADCAEDFDVSATGDLEPGTVMVIDGEGRLRPSDAEYDKRVAGVLSGAGAYRPGIVLGRTVERQDKKAVALIGRVYCKVDADHGPIAVGDLMTTSPTRGHAMKAADPQRAFGAVIGKALRPLQRGRDLIPILVALQ